MKNFLAVLLGCVICAGLGFAGHNYFSWNEAQNNAKPVIKKIIREKYQLEELPYSKIRMPRFKEQKFPQQEVVNEQYVTDNTPRQNAPVNEVLEYRFNQAVNDSNVSYDPDTGDNLSFAISDLPENLQRQIPEFTYESHIYSSKIEDRFITLNNQRYHEGDQPFGVLKVVKIEPNSTVFRIGNVAFSLSSLTDWPGAGN